MFDFFGQMWIKIYLGLLKMGEYEYFILLFGLIFANINMYTNIIKNIMREKKVFMDIKSYQIMLINQHVCHNIQFMVFGL